MQGTSQKLGDISHVQTAHQIEAVHFDGAYADLKHVCDFPVCVPDRHQTQDVALSGCQEFQIDGLVNDRFDFSA